MMLWGQHSRQKDSDVLQARNRSQNIVARAPQVGRGVLLAEDRDEGGPILRAFNAKIITDKRLIFLICKGFLDTEK